MSNFFQKKSEFVLFLCSYIAKGSNSIDTVNILQAERVIPSQLMSTVIQHGTIALQKTKNIKKNQAKKEDIYNDWND